MLDSTLNTVLVFLLALLSLPRPAFLHGVLINCFPVARLSLAAAAASDNKLIWYAGYARFVFEGRPNNVPLDYRITVRRD